ncbi:MAG: DUF1800 family protein, partial [Phycisphaerae bacterium]|nr:DUF1800 family protein [Phycisphaerae bacterium]
MARTLEPLPEKDFGYWEAEHLLNRAGFGGTPRQILALSNMGLKKAVDYLIEWERIKDPLTDGSGFRADIMHPLSQENRAQIRKARQSEDERTIEKFRAARQERQREDRQQMQAIQSWWLERLIETPRPLHEKLTLFWHGHFATGYRAVEDS